MRMVDIREATGHRLGQPVRDATGRILLAAGVPLTAGVCDALIRRGYMHLCVADGVADDIMPMDSLAPKTRAQALAAARACFAHLSQGQAVPFTQVVGAVDAILADLEHAGTAVLEFSALRAASEYTYTHSVNVCAYSLVVAQLLGFTEQDMRIVGTGAMLHDVGKLLCADLCAKAGPLDDAEWARMRQHPTDGFEMLRHHHELHLFVAHTAFQHHERMDGSGYPRGLRGEQILPCARIVGVTDTFDALTADRPHARAVPPHDAMHEISKSAGVGFDAEIVRLFMARMAVYPAGTPVRLHDGAIAIVASQTANAETPLVRILGRAGHAVPEQEPIAATGTLRIVQTLAHWPLWLERHEPAHSELTGGLRR